VFTGRRDINGTYVEPPFLRLYETGGIVLLDEFDAADPNVALVINSALANCHLSVPLRAEKPVADRHPDFAAIIATNTWGLGPDGTYTGREGLDASTRDRAAVAKIRIGYSESVEASYLPKSDKLGAALRKVRENVEAQKIRRVVSTRAFEQAARLRAAGMSDRAILNRFLLDWTDAERAKALAGVSL
jgi:cobaltochelatase CobS